MATSKYKTFPLGIVDGSLSNCPGRRLFQDVFFCTGRRFKLCALDLGLRTASVAWSAPGENGGSPVVGYLAEAREHSSRRTRARAHCGPDAREATFEGGLLDCGSDSAK